MKKQLTAAFLICVLVISSITPASAATKHELSETNVLAVLKELEIMVGDASGNLNLNGSITRAEFAKMLVSASSYRDSVSSVANVSPFKDVPGTHWAAGYIKLAVQQGWLTGYLDGTYRPDQNITLEEAVTAVDKLLGYTTEDFTGAFPYAQLSLGESLGLLQNITQSQGETMTRRSMARLFYNALVATNKSGTVHLVTLGHTVMSDGEADLETLLDLEREGPMAVSSGWESSMPFSVSDAVIYRDDKRASLSDIEEYDVLYWSSDCAILWAYSDRDIMTELSNELSGPVIVASGWQSSISFDVTSSTTVIRNGKNSSYSSIAIDDVVYWSKVNKTLYVYSNKVTGMVTEVSPSYSAPTSVTISGKSYTLETSAAKYLFSDLGTVRVGDTITALLGRDGGIVGVASGVSESAVAYGVLTDIGTQTYTDSSGNSYVSDVYTITTTAGESASYQYSGTNYFSVGNLVSAQVKDGEVQITRLSKKSLSGSINSAGTSLGSYTLASDIEILDVYGSSAVRIYPSRLAGITLESSSVLYYETNSRGELATLILDDVTGDMHQYGVLTSVSETESGISMSGSYHYDIAGQSGNYQLNNQRFNVSTGPFVMKTDGSSVKMSNLNSVSLTSVSASVAYNDTSSYSLSDTVVVYRKQGANYYLTSLDAVLSGSYTLTGWYDKAQSDGGRIRVIVAS